MANLFVFAEITPKTEFFEAAKLAINGIVDATRREAGCHQFDVFISEKGESLCLFEAWENDEALALHYQMPYTKRVFQAYETWLDKAPQILKLTKTQTQ